MATCATCGLTILFGGVRDSGFRFCGKKCAEKCTLLQAIRAVPEDLVLSEATRVFNGPCPECGGNGPVDMRFHHHIHSLIYLTSWKSHGNVSCAACAKKRQVGAILYCGALGWWGIPFGVLGTPVQIGRNVTETVRSKRVQPSKALLQHVRQTIAKQNPTPYVRSPGAF